MEPSKKRRRITTVLWILLAVFAAGAGLFLWCMPTPDALAKKVAASFAESTGVPCSISGPANVRFFPVPAVTLHGVRLGALSETQPGDAETSGASSVAVEIPLLQVRLSYLSLLKGDVFPSKIRIHDPIVNVNALLELCSSLKTPEDATASLSRDTLNKVLDIVRILRIVGGRFAWKTQDGKQIVIDKIYWEDSFLEDAEVRFQAHGLTESPDPWDVKLEFEHPFWDGGVLHFPVAASLATVFSGQSLQPELAMDVGVDVDTQTLHVSSGYFGLQNTIIAFSGAVSGLAGTKDPIEADITTDLQHVSLSRWLGGVRETPEILQWLLNDISGRARFRIKGERMEMELKDIVLPAGTIENANGVFDAAVPSLTLNLKPHQARLETIFPVLKDPAWKPQLDYSLPPLISSTDSGTSAPFVYDVSVNAQQASWEMLQAKNVRVRFVPDKKNVRMDASGSLYGGRAQAEVLFLDKSDMIRIGAEFSNIRIEEGLAQYLSKPLVRGTAWGKCSISANSANFSAFTRTVKGTASVTLRNGAFIREAGNSKSAVQAGIPFESFELKGKASASGEKSGVLLYDGHWTGGMESKKFSVSATLDGRFGVRASSGELLLERVKTTCTGTGQLPFFLVGQATKFSGAAVASYDQQRESVVLDSCTLTLPDVSLSGTAQGKNIHNEKSFSWTGGINLHTPSARKLLTALGFGEALPAGGLREMSFAAKYSLGPDEVSFSDCRLLVDESTVSGSVRVYGVQDSRPAFDLSAVVDSLDLDTYLPSSENTLHSDKKVYDFSGLRSLKAKGRVVVTKFCVRHVPFSQVVCNFVAESGIMAVFFDSILYGGKLQGDWRGNVQMLSEKSGNVSGTDRGKLEYSSTLSGKNVSLKLFSQNIFGDAYIEGTSAFFGTFQGTVRDSDDLLKACQGTWTISAEKGFFCSSGSEKARPVKSRNNRSMTEFYSGAQSEEPVRNYFDTALVRGELKQGVLSTKELSVKGPVMSMNGDGTIDLLNDTINMDLDVHLAGVQVPIKVSGPFNQIRTNFKSGQFVTGNLYNLFKGIFSLPLTILKLPGKLVE